MDEEFWLPKPQLIHKNHTLLPRVWISTLTILHLYKGPLTQKKLWIFYYFHSGINNITYQQWIKQTANTIISTLLKTRKRTMREITPTEAGSVSGGAPATADEVNAFFEGIVWGIIDGLATGVTVGGSASRSTVFGIISQGIGALAGGIIGPIAGAFIGATEGRDAVAAYAADFRAKYAA